MLSIDHYPPCVVRFLKDEDGAVTTDYVFMTASVTAAGFAVLTSLSGGIEDMSVDIVSEITESEIIFMSQNFGRDRETVLREAPLAYFTPDEVITRYEFYIDPTRRTDAQVRNAHRTWSRRMASTSYSNPAYAQDIVLVLEHALEVRNLEPHDGF